MPGQFCGQSDQGKYVLGAGIRRVSSLSGSGDDDEEGKEEEEGETIQREGFQERGSGQNTGWVCTARRLGMMPVLGGMVIVFRYSSVPVVIVSSWGCSFVHLGRARMGG